VQEKHRDSLLFFSLFIMILCNSAKAMDGTESETVDDTVLKAVVSKYKIPGTQRRNPLGPVRDHAVPIRNPLRPVRDYAASVRDPAASFCEPISPAVKEKKTSSGSHSTENQLSELKKITIRTQNIQEETALTRGRRSISCPSSCPSSGSSTPRFSLQRSESSPNLDILPESSLGRLTQSMVKASNLELNKEVLELKKETKLMALKLEKLKVTLELEQLKVAATSHLEAQKTKTTKIQKQIESMALELKELKAKSALELKKLKVAATSQLEAQKTKTNSEFSKLNQQLETQKTRTTSQLEAQEIKTNSEFSKLNQQLEAQEIKTNSEFSKLNQQLETQETRTTSQLEAQEIKTNFGFSKLNQQLEKQTAETTSQLEKLETATDLKSERQQKKETKGTKETEFLESIKPILYTLGTLGVAIGVKYLFCLSATEKRNGSVETLRQSMVDVKELEVCSLFSIPLLLIPFRPLHRVINGHNEVDNIAKNSIINFAGETANALALRYLHKLAAMFIANRLECSKYPAVKTILESPFLRYSIIRILWCLEQRLFKPFEKWCSEKFAIN